jgi:ABC-type transport system involved in multi-copper enzyme maturation permease subunit
MGWRWGPGPVFAVELRGAARRWQTFVLRACFVAALLGALSLVWWSLVLERQTLSVKELARVGEGFYYALVGTQLALLLLAAPAATAGAVCQDKARGGLLHLLVTDLSDAEIVLGKLAARLVPVFSLLLAGLPVLAVATLLGGIDPGSVFGAFLVSAGVAVLGCALALALSVWAGKTHEALLAAYGLEVVALLAAPVWVLVGQIARGPGAPALPVWLKKSNPFWLAFAPYTSPRATDPREPLWFLAGSLALAAVLTLAAVATVRRVAIRQAGATERRRQRQRWRLPSPWRWLPGPSLSRNPVLWREWHRRRPSRWMQTIWGLFAVGAVVATALSVPLGPIDYRSREPPVVTNMFVVVLGLLLFCVSAVTSLSEERARGSLDVLLTTPLSTGSIVWGKWWGTFRTVPLLAALPAVSMAALNRGWESWPLAVLGVGLILAYGAALTSLGLALATWLPRLGRAAAWSAIGYVLMAIVPMMAAGLLQDRIHRFEWIAAGSPFFGVAAVTESVAAVRDYRPPGQERWVQLVGPAALWVGAYTGLAAALLGATLLTFDRCLGRVRQRRPRQSAA